MKRFLIGFAVVAAVIIVSAGIARADRGRRHAHVYASVSTSYYVPTTDSVPTVIATPTVVVPTVVAPTVFTSAVVAPTYVGPVVSPVVTTSYVPTVQTTVYRVGRRHR
jgi:hypothetical protein